MNKRHVTLAQIAEKSEKHITTVSLAIRNSPKLSKKTRENIQKLAKEMGYKPDPLLRALSSYRTKNTPNHPVIAYLTNWNSRWGWRDTYAHPTFYDAAKKAADNLGFQLEHFWLREPGLTHKRLNTIFKTRGIEGIIVASHVVEIDDTLEFEWENFSAVKIDYFPHKPNLHVITNNQLQITRLAVQEIIKLGYKRIGFVIDENWDKTVDNLYAAGFYWEQLKIDQNNRIPPYLIPGETTIKEWIIKYKPEVIIGKKSIVYPILQEMNLKVPKDIAFVDIFNEDQSGEIAGVKQNHIRVGELSIEILSSQIQHRIKGIPEVSTTTHVDGTWIPGNSLPPKV